MVVIRLARGGVKKTPFYHVVIADKREPRDGRYIERVGYFNPTARGQETRIKLIDDRIAHWIKQGAQASNRVKTLIKAVKNGDENYLKSDLLIVEQKKAQLAVVKKAAPEKTAAATETPPEPTASAAVETKATATTEEKPAPAPKEEVKTEAANKKEQEKEA